MMINHRLHLRYIACIALTSAYAWASQADTSATRRDSLAPRDAGPVVVDTPPNPGYHLLDSNHPFGQKSGTVKPRSSIASKDSVLTIAIGDFMGRGLDSITAQLFSDRFRASLIGRPNLKVLERSQMDVILKEQGFQKSGACDYDACLVEIGQLLGTQFIVAGNVGKVEDIYSFNIRMIQVQTGEIIYSCIQDVRQPLLEVLSKVIPELAGKFHDEVTRVSSASLDVRSEPQKASVMFDGREAGLTPLQLKGIDDGKHALLLSMTHCVDVRDTLFLKRGSSSLKIYKMSYTGGYLDSLMEKRKRIIRLSARAAGAAASVAAFAAAVYSETRLHSIADDQERIIREYDNAGAGADFVSFRNRTSHNATVFDKWKKYRTVGIAAGAVLAAGVTATFFF
jgi:hypothetical protein